MTSQVPSHARVFRQLHDRGLLVLPNAWDAGSARLIESLGARAIATSSAAVAWSHGYPDGDILPVRLLVATVEDISRVITVPLSVDIEGGYSEAAAAVGETAARVIEAGAVGVNVEDGSASPELLCAKIEQSKRAAASLGVDLFVNARTDVYLAGLVPEERRIEETLARAERYRAAGADGLFVPAVVDPTAIRTIASSVRLPLNVLARPGLPLGSELEALGVRRLSAGSGIAQSVFGLISSLASAFLHDGRSDALGQGALSYAAINALMPAVESRPSP
jgi:2-methylisocitrate lyase-like PEP mutase family enzyme